MKHIIENVTQSVLTNGALCAILKKVKKLIDNLSPLYRGTSRLDKCKPIFYDMKCAKNILII